MTVIKLRDEALVWREIDGELVAVDVGASAYLAANRSGTLLWRLLAHGATREALAAALVDAFGIAPDRAETDADLFVEALKRRGLLTA